MKKIGYILLVAILLMQTGGLLLFYRMQQIKVQHDMQLALNNASSGFQKLSLSLNEFQKAKINANEISFNGKMYDVKSVKISGNNVELIVLNDNKEENIIENIKKSVNTNNQQNSKIPNQLVTVLNWFYTASNFWPDFTLPNEKQNVFPAYCENFISHISSITVPPPKFS